MRYLYKLFHEKDARDFQDVYERRFHYDSTVRLGLTIKPMNQANIYELYYVPTNKMIDLVGRIYTIAARFQETFKGLPEVAQDQFMMECLVEELYNTNELEGIRSTREEIARSAREAKLNKKGFKRFESMIRSYMRLLHKDVKLPVTPHDIRAIYDDITDGEIERDELPDGDIFRKDTTYVLKQSGTGKVVHQGVTPEREVIRAVEQLLAFMNENHQIPLPIKVAIGHYYFGYIHPFYDGNGRTSRFISSMYFSQGVEHIPALSLSRGCNAYRKNYLEAFEFTTSIRNRGEMNGFIEAFLEIIAETLEQMAGELKEKSELLGIAARKLKHDPLLKSKEERELMYVLAQHHFFDSGGGLTTKELADIVQKSEATVRKMMKQLLALSLVEQRGERPAYYFIKQSYFEE